MTRSTASLIALCVCGAALLAMAIWGGRRTHNAHDFFIASRRLSAWLVALGYTANATPVWMLFVICGAAFAWGLAAIWIAVAVVLGYVLNCFWIAPRLRQLSVGQGTLSLVQVLGNDAGDRMQPLIVRSAALILAIVLTLEIAAVVNMAAHAFADTAGFDVTTVKITAVVVIVVFTLAGGFWSMNLSDAVQTGIVMLVGLSAPLLTFGVYDLEQARIAFGALGPAHTDWFGNRHGVVAIAFVIGVAGFGFDLMGQSHAVNRFMAARDETTLAAARWIAPLAIAILLGAMLLCGWSASLLYSGLDRADRALLVAIERMLPPALSAVIVTVLLGALVIGMGNRLLILASSVSSDMRRSLSPISYAWGRVVLVVYAIVALCVALYASDSLLDQAMFAFTVAGASFGPLLLVRLAGKRVRPGSTLGAIWAGFVLTLLFHALPDSPGDFLERVLPFVAALGIALSGGERRRNPDRADRGQQTVHDRVPI